MFLVSVGTPRSSHNEAAKWLELSKNKNQEIQYMRTLAKNTFEEFNLAQSGEHALTVLSQGMDESWTIKRKLSNSDSKLTNESIVDKIISRGKNAGALAGKLCGAGGSGFVLFLVDESAQNYFLNEFKDAVIRKIKIESQGSRLESYSNYQKEALR